MKTPILWTFFGRALVVAMALPGPVMAETDRIRYRVDLIVFENLSDRLPATTERTQQPPLIDFESTVDAGDDVALRTAGIRPISDAQFGLLAEWRRLRNSRYHRPLLRRSWIQFGYGEDRAPVLRFHDGTPLVLAIPERAVAVAANERRNDLLVSAIDEYRSFRNRRSVSTYRIDGSIQLVTSRFLHLVIDLRMIESNVAGAASATAGEVLDASEVRWHRLNEDRRVRRDELHFIDHPRFGLLARVSAIEPVVDTIDPGDADAADAAAP